MCVNWLQPLLECIRALKHPDVIAFRVYHQMANLLERMFPFTVGRYPDHVTLTRACTAVKPNDEVLEGLSQAARFTRALNEARYRDPFDGWNSTCTQ